METFNYFTGVGTKSSVKSNVIHSTDGSRPDLMASYLEKYDPLKRNKLDIDATYRDWCIRIFQGLHNVVVTGIGSKYRLLETFKTRYLDTGYVMNNINQPSNKRKVSLRKKSVCSTKCTVSTVRIHSFEPVTLEQFTHSLFGITMKRKLDDHDVLEFIKNVKLTRSHFVFMLHSFDLLYRESEDVCNLIFKLYTLSPEYMHILLSSDHVHEGKRFTNLKSKLRLLSYDVSDYGESFFKERTYTVCVMEDGTNENAALVRPFDGHISLQSLRDVYQALQGNTQTILVYILKHHVERSEAKENFDEPTNAKRQKSTGTRRSTRTRVQAPNLYLEYQTLMKYGESHFIVRRQDELNAHLGELVDHKIVELNEARSEIECIVPLETCKKFLDDLEAS